MLKGKEHPIAPFVCIAQQGSDMWETHKQLRMIGRIKLQNSVRVAVMTVGAMLVMNFGQVARGGRYHTLFSMGGMPLQVDIVRASKIVL